MIFKLMKMKKLALLIVFFVFGYTSYSQLYVNNGSYIFNNDNVFFVKQDVNLNGNGAIYLRKGGQLVQGRTTAGANVGTGLVSVYQEGTSNNFGYNYWCSPVGNSNLTAINSNFSINQLHRATTVTSSVAATILPLNNYNGVSTNSSLSIAPYWVWKYIASNAYNTSGSNGWISVNSTGTVEPGLGFTMKGVSGSDNTIAHPVSGSLGDGVSNNPLNNQRYDFRGKPNDGTILIPVGSVAGANYANNTLAGNPYPSSINLNLFLLENSGYTINYGTGTYSYTGGIAQVIDGKAYFWEQKKTANSHYLADYEGGYGTYSPTGPSIASPGTYVAATWDTYNANGTPNTTGLSSGSTYKRMFTPIGQGFMIQGVVSGNAVMKNLYRSFVKEGVIQNSQFEKNAIASSVSDNWDEIPNVAGIDYENFSKLPAPQFKLHTIINNQFTKESAVVFNNNSSDGYDFAMDASSSDNFAKDSYFPIVNNEKFIITTMPFGTYKKIPLAFVTDANCSFKVTVSELINFDLSNEIYLHDKVSDIYYDIKNGFFETVLQTGNYLDRFEITFTASALNTVENFEENFAIYQNNDLETLTVENTELIDLQYVSLFDIGGKVVFQKEKLGANTIYQFPTSSISDGIYIVKLVASNNQSLSHKIIIKHSRK